MLASTAASAGAAAAIRSASVDAARSTMPGDVIAPPTNSVARDGPLTGSAFVRLSRKCNAARGPVFGSGYLIEPRG